MKTSRGKEVKKILEEFKYIYPKDIDHIIKHGDDMQQNIEKKLCADDENNQPPSDKFPLIDRSHQNQSLPIFIPRQSSPSIIHSNKKDIEFGVESQS